MLLAVDTSTRSAGLALYDGAQVLVEMTWTSRDFHTVELAPAIEKAFQQAGLDASALRALGVAIGPGSFTGLRIGLALVKGLALGRRLPLVGVPTLDILAAAQPLPPADEPDCPLLAVLQAGRGRLAVAAYRAVQEAWQAQGAPEVLDITRLYDRIERPTYICGELSADERHMLARRRKNARLASPAHCLRRPGFLAELAWARWQAGQVNDPLSLSPMYLHIGDPILMPGGTG